MRILKVVQAYFPFQEKGGPVVKVRSIALGLAARGHSVTVLTTNYGLRSTLPPRFAIEKVKSGLSAEENGVTAIYLRSFGRYRALTLNPGVISFAAGSVSHFDLAHIYGLYDLLGPAVAFFCRRRGIPYVVEPMGMYRPIVRNLRMKKIYHRALGDRLLSEANRLVATSEQEKQELIRGGIEKERIIVRRNGIEAPRTFPAPGTFRQQWRISSRAKLILYLGRLVPKKSPNLLIDAFVRWRHASRDGAESVLVLAGPGGGNGYGASLKVHAQSSGVSECVLFTGPLYDDAKWAAYRDTDVFVLPSQNENFGNSAAEAVACGTPVIVTDQCGIATIIAERAGLVVTHDAGAIAKALGLILGDSNLAAQFRVGCAEVAANLTWDEPLTHMELLYRETAAGTRRSEMAF
ncbi:MAG TPA: glycosyltransferase [Candidatus Acidoferrales bacterium]|nr:glycosyltransferase [Candidatus Acidoferrales bacterium]